jgi:DeoR family transcriptional regulator of aga operon
MMEAQLNRKMIEAAQKTIVLADSSKFGKRGFGKICGLEDIEQVITDSGISDHTAKALKNMGMEVTIV